ncbi:hypothetical protein RI367_003319 [Sorochytrium milnesiophthora]
MTDPVLTFISERYTIAEYDAAAETSPFTSYLGRDKVDGSLVSIKVERRKPGQTFETDQEARIYQRLAGHGPASGNNRIATMLHHHKVLNCGILVLRHTPASLEDVMKEHISELIMLSIMAQLIAAVQHMHAANVVHANLQPVNVRVDKTGRVALVNFRLSNRGRAAVEKCPVSFMDNWWSVGKILLQLALASFVAIPTSPGLYEVPLEEEIQRLGTHTLLQSISHEPIRRVVNEFFSLCRATQKCPGQVFNAERILSTLTEVSGDQGKMTVALGQWAVKVIEPLHKKAEATIQQTLTHAVITTMPRITKEVDPRPSTSGAQAAVTASFCDIKAAIQKALQQYDAGGQEAALTLTPQQAAEQEQQLLLTLTRVLHSNTASPLSTNRAGPFPPYPVARSTVLRNLSGSFKVNHVLWEPSASRATDTERAVTRPAAATETLGILKRLPIQQQAAKLVQLTPDIKDFARDRPSFGQ